MREFCAFCDVCRFAAQAQSFGRLRVCVAVRNVICVSGVVALTRFTWQACAGVCTSIILLGLSSLKFLQNGSNSCWRCSPVPISDTSRKHIKAALRDRRGAWNIVEAAASSFELWLFCLQAKVAGGTLFLKMCFTPRARKPAEYFVEGVLSRKACRSCVFRYMISLFVRAEKHGGTRTV